MKTIKINNQKQLIDCENECCGNCSYRPQMGEQLCKLFNVPIDYVNNPIVNNSGWKRCEECIKAEEIE